MSSLRSSSLLLYGDSLVARVRSAPTGVLVVSSIDEEVSVSEAEEREEESVSEREELDEEEEVIAADRGKSCRWF